MKLKFALIALICIGSANAKMHNKPIRNVIDNDVVPIAKPLQNQTAKDVMCLAYSIYREAGNLAPSAQYAVGQVHINRLLEGSWGDSLCEVVFAKAQFSWTLEKKKVIWSDKQRFFAREIAEGLVKSLNSKRILHYHANYVKPKWGKQSKAVAMAGPHIFYKDIAH